MIQNPKIMHEFNIRVRLVSLKKKAWRSLLLWGLLLIVNLFNLIFRIYYQKWDDWGFIVIEIFAGVWGFIYTCFYLERVYYLRRELEEGYVDYSCHLCANTRCYYHHKEILTQEPEYSTFACGKYISNGWELI